MPGVALLHTVRVYLGLNHAGFELEGFLVGHLTPSCIETARRVVAGPGCIRGVIGGLGNGEQISANKVAGCRVALAWSSETARLAREHNDTQVVGVGARMHGPAGAAEIVEAFLATLFSGGEWYGRPILLIADFEAAGDAAPISAG